MISYIQILNMVITLKDKSVWRGNRYEFNACGVEFNMQERKNDSTGVYSTWISRSDYEWIIRIDNCSFESMFELQPHQTMRTRLDVRNMIPKRLSIKSVLENALVTGDTTKLKYDLMALKMVQTYSLTEDHLTEA